MAQTRVAVIGCGYWGKNHVRTFAELGALSAVADANPATAEAQGKQHNARAISIGEAIEGDAADAVSICAPAEFHADLAIRALRAGKHVLVEKPLALTMKEGEAVKKAGQDAGRIVMVGHLLQYHPAFATLREFVRGGGLGKLRYAYSHRLSLGKFRIEENTLWSFAPHDVSMLMALFGEQPSKISGAGGAYVTPGVEDEFRLDLEYPSGARAHVFTSWLHPFKEHRLVVVGETGMAVFEDSAADPAHKLRLYRHVIDASGGVPEPKKADAEPIPYPSHEPLKEECRHFLHCCDTGSRPLTDADEALSVLNILVQAGK